MRERTTLTDAERVLEELRMDAALALSGRAPVRRQELPPVRLAMASVAWLWGIFAVCYVALPVTSYAAGLEDAGALWVLPASTVGWLAASVMTAFAVLVNRPAISKDHRADPVIAATLGGLVVWALSESLFPFFRPFTEFGGWELAWFAARNVLEMGLLGAMWASFTRRPALAFALGAAFQALTTGVVATLVLAGF
jgi:hypothetical protein